MVSWRCGQRAHRRRAPSVAQLVDMMMQRKRKLTAAFCEIPQEKDALKRSWRAGEHCDWTVILDTKEFHIHKVIVATGDRASAFLAASFRKHCGKNDTTDLTTLVPQKCWSYFESLLDFVYGSDVEVTIDNWAQLVKMADLLQIGSLYTRCVEAGSDLITSETAPKVVATVNDLQLGGDLQQEVEQIAIDVMTPLFSSYKPKDLIMLPVPAFQALLRRDDLDIPNEDSIFEFLMHISVELGSETMAQLWRCCRLQNLSPERVLEVALVNEIPKEAIVWALACKGAPPREVLPPAWVASSEWAEHTGPRGREITFLVPNASGYANKRHLRSPAHQLCERFSWRLLIFPLGTDSTGHPKQVAAFVELIPEAGVDSAWILRRVKYSITLVNWTDERRNITKDHTFDFCAAEVDNGWHRGWVTPDSMTMAQGWLNENGELHFKASCCVRNASLAGGT